MAFLRANPGILNLYRLTVNDLGRLPWEVYRIPKPGERAPTHQVILALAMKRADDEDAANILRARIAKQREIAQTPPKWRRIHAKVDQAARALDGWEEP